MSVPACVWCEETDCAGECEIHNDDYCDQHDLPRDQCDCDFLENICGMMPDGQCALAGSEECDWDCPRNSIS